MSVHTVEVERIYAIDRGDGRIAWEQFTDGSERPILFSRRRDARLECIRHNKEYGINVWKPMVVTISWRVP